MRAPVVILPQLDSAVEVTFDVRGFPDVHARTKRDAVLALGFLVAADRLGQLDLLRRAAAGRLAEVLGPPALAGDRRARTLGLGAAAESAYRSLPATHRRMLEAYAAGVEAWRSSRPDAETGLQRVDEPWRPSDGILVALGVAMQLSGAGEEQRMVTVMRDVLPPDVAAWLLQDADDTATDLRGRPVSTRLDPMPVDALAALVAEARVSGSQTDRPIVGADGLGSASNAWAVGNGDVAADTAIVLANDLHLPLGVPPPVWCGRLRWQGGEVRGVTFPGLPLVVAGTNGRVAWGVTRLATLTSRLISVVDVAVRERVETIAVRGAEPVRHTIRTTPWGPLWSAPLDGVPLALRWSPVLADGVNTALLDLWDAGDVGAATAVAAAARGVPLNVVVGDRSGRVGWAASGGFCADAPGVSGEPIGVATIDEAAADPGWLPTGQVARAVCSGGRLLNANNGRHGAGSPAVNAEPGARAHRIAESLSTGGTHGLADVAALQTDVAAPLYRWWQTLALTAARGAADLADVSADVVAWDGTASPATRGLAALVLFRELVREQLLAAVLSRCTTADPDFYYTWRTHELLVRALVDSADDRLAPPPFDTMADFLVVQLRMAAGLLHGRGLGAAHEWGEANRWSPTSPLAAVYPELADLLSAGEVRTPGCDVSVNMSRPGFAAVVRIGVRLDRGHGAPEVRIGLAGDQFGSPATGAAREHLSAWCDGHWDPLPGPAVAQQRLVPSELAIEPGAGD